VGDYLGVLLKLPPPFECVIDLLRVLHHKLSSLGLFLRPYSDEHSTPSSDFSFRLEHDRLFFQAAVIRLVCFFIIYFSVI
jgi:hypothetical protein